MSHDHKLEQRPAVQRRAAMGEPSRGRPALQRRARGPVQRLGRPLPPGVHITGIDAGNPDAIINMIRSTQRSMVAGGSPQFPDKSELIDDIRSAFAENTFSSSTLRTEYIDDTLLNHQWSIQVHLNVLGPEVPIGPRVDGSGTGGSTGSSQRGSQTTDGTSSTVSVGGQAGSQTGPDEAQTSSEVSASASQTDSHQRQRSTQHGGGRAASHQLPMQGGEFQQMICADIRIRVNAEPIQGVTDLNPFTVGANIGSAMLDAVDAVAGTQLQTREVTVPFAGFVRYTRTTGVAAGNRGGGGQAAGS